MRQRILVLNQYYKPGMEATANLLADLCQDLAKRFDVVVVTARARGVADLPTKEVLDGVAVYRTGSTRFDRTRRLRRGLNYLPYLGDSLLRANTLWKVALVVCMT